jgi:hypothetical protein
MLSRDVVLDNRERRVDHHIYRFVEGPTAISISLHEVPLEKKKYLISSSISEAREERSKLPTRRGCRIFLENDLIQGRGCIGLPSHERQLAIFRLPPRVYNVRFLGCSSIVWQLYQPIQYQSCTTRNSEAKTYRMENH